MHVVTVSVPLMWTDKRSASFQGAPRGGLVHARLLLVLVTVLAVCTVWVGSVRGGPTLGVNKFRVR